MKKINKKDIVVLIVLIIMLIIQIKAFNNSRADKLLDITATITDYDDLLNEETVILTALNEAESGISITLPEIINTKKVSKYIVIEKEILSESDETEEVEETENIEEVEGAEEVAEVETKKEEETGNELETGENLEEIAETTEESLEEKNVEITEVEMLPGEKIYLTAEEQENLAITLMVKYDTIETDEQTLYNKKLMFEQGNNEILEVTGYMPADTSMQVSETNLENVEDKILQNYPNDILIGNYSIKLISGEEEYLPSKYSQTLKIQIVAEEGDYSYTVLEINENEIIKNENITVKNGIIQFETEEIKPYVILVFVDEDNPSVIDDTDNSLIFEIDDYESDKNYYLGLNYTENNSKNYTGKYTASNLKDVQINYYGYNYDENDETEIGKISDTEKQTVVSYRKCVTVDTSRKYNHKIDR